MAIIPLLAIPGFMALGPQDGAKVTGCIKTIAALEAKTNLVEQC
jgi:hypothetical protein